MRSINTDKNLMEIKRFGSADFPFMIDRVRIHEYENKQTLCHWHKELEFILVRSGRMKCKINDTEYIVSAGECLFTNANMLHMGEAIDEEDCSYSAISMNPSVFGQGNTRLKERFIDSIIECPALDSFIFKRDVEWQNNIIKKMKKIDVTYKKKPDCYELEIISLLLGVWAVFYQNTKQYIEMKRVPDEKDIKLKNILTYINDYYKEKITLDDMARAAGISKSSCSHIFKSYMKESPFEYLLRFRIDKSLSMLVNNNMNITETALAAGFSSGSYYAEIFKRYMNLSPQEYKRQKDLETES